MTYNIVKHSYFDEYGKEHDIKYQIRTRKKFFIWSYWEYVTHRECGMGDCYNTRTSWGTREKAELFIKETLCPNKIYDSHSTISVLDVNCS